jgi:hypothetical protein
MEFDKNKLDNLIKRRFFYDQAFGVSPHALTRPSLAC